MTPLDLLDQSFLRRKPTIARLHAATAAVRSPAPNPASNPAPTSATAGAPKPSPPSAAQAVPAAATVPPTTNHGAPAPARPTPHGTRPAVPTAEAVLTHDGIRLDGDPLLDRSFAAATLAWNRVADCVAEAHTRGRRSIAVTGANRRAGCATLVQGVAHLLRQRGIEVGHDNGTEPRGPWDDRLALVDAGPWFAPGPLRRRTLEQRSIGYDAVIIVRHADEPPCPARGTMLEAIGLEVLGEVVTFALAADSPA